jgi:hypothetical protein
VRTGIRPLEPVDLLVEKRVEGVENPPQKCLLALTFGLGGRVVI